MGDISLVWSWQAFIAAGVFGFLYGYVVMHWLCRRERWKALVAPGVYGWIVAMLTAFLVLGMSVSQVIAALAEGDDQWVRILSRMGPNMACAAAVGAGVYFALRNKARSEG